MVVGMISFLFMLAIIYAALGVFMYGVRHSAQVRKGGQPSKIGDFFHVVLKTYGKQCPAEPRWVEGRYTAQEKMLFTPISQLVENAEAKAVREYYGEEAPSKGAIQSIALELKAVDKGTLEERAQRVLLADPLQMPPDKIIPENTALPLTAGYAHNAATVLTGDWQYDPITQANTYSRYVPGIGIIRSDTPEKLERAIAVAAAEAEIQRYGPEVAAEICKLKVEAATRNQPLRANYFLDQFQTKEDLYLSGKIPTVEQDEYREIMKYAVERIRALESLPKSVVDVPGNAEEIEKLKVHYRKQALAAMGADFTFSQGLQPGVNKRHH